MRIIGKVYKVGNSVAVSVPRHFRQLLGLDEGDFVELRSTGRGALLLRRVDNKTTSVAARLARSRNPRSV